MAISTELIIAPSLLAADFSRLGQEIAAIHQAGAKWLHFDVMDNHYVPNLTFGPPVLRSLKKSAPAGMLFDVHLMVRPVDSLINDFIEAGADIISFHPEASDHVDRSLRLIKDGGCLAGLAFNPATALGYLDYTLELLDLVLIMSVNPGFGGQKFIESVYPKIQVAKQKISGYQRINPRPIRLEVDGGVNAAIAERLRQAGADTLVAGSAVFGSADYVAAIAGLKGGLKGK